MKLIIWDFDGVVADTEKLWMEIELEELNKYCGLDWNFATIVRYLSGQGLTMQKKVLADMAVFPPEEMWQKVAERSYTRILQGFERTVGIEGVLKLKGYRHAMATGGTLYETLLKLKAIGLQDIFTEKNLVTIDMVAQGKPEPDSFLLAARKMHFQPENCYVVEDSIAGLTAAKRTQMTVVCFAGSTIYKHLPQQREAVQKLGITHIFDTMQEVRTFFEQERSTSAD